MAGRTTDSSQQLSHALPDFEDLLDIVIPKYIKLLRLTGEQKPGRMYWIDNRSKTLILSFRLKPRLIYPVIIHLSTRKHYTPLSRVCDEKTETGHFYSACRVFHRLQKKRGHELRARFVRDRTIFLIGNSYTRSVKGRIKKTYSGMSIGAIVIKKFSELTEALKSVWNWILNYISARLTGLRKALKEKGVKAFGVVAEFEKNLSLIIESISLLFLQ